MRASKTAALGDIGLLLTFLCLGTTGCGDEGPRSASSSSSSSAGAGGTGGESSTTSSSSSGSSGGGAGTGGESSTTSSSSSGSSGGAGTGGESSKTSSSSSGSSGGAGTGGESSTTSSSSSGSSGGGAGTGGAATTASSSSSSSGGTGGAATTASSSSSSSGGTGGSDGSGGTGGAPSAASSSGNASSVVSSSSGGTGGAAGNDTSSSSSGGGASASTSSSTGGAVGCVTPLDCPGTDTACAMRTCIDGTCGMSFVAAGTALAAQTLGDCQTSTCDGDGAVVVAADPTDAPTSSNDCLAGSCAGDTPALVPVAAGVTCTQGGGAVCDGSGSCVPCVSDAQCPSGICTAHVCRPLSCGNGVKDGTETDVDCGGPDCGPCAIGKQCANNGDCAGEACRTGVCSAYPFPPTGGPTSSWSDCSVGLDPAKNGGDLLWAKTMLISGVFGTCADGLSYGQQLALGPTGDIVVGEECHYIGNETLAHYDRLNGSGVLLDARSHMPAGFGASNHYGWTRLVIDPDNNLFAAAAGNESCPDGPFGYCPVSVSEEISPGGQIVSPSCHEHSTQALTSVQDFGCGPVTPTSPSGGVIVHKGPSCGCLYSRALPVVTSVDWRASAGAVLYVTSSTPLDLGCGTLPADAGGSTLVTRLDPSGQCVFGASLGAPNLTAALDPAGRVVLSGLVGAAPVDLGGGPLAPLGSQDFVIVELDASGNHVWSRRFGASGVTFAKSKVTVSQAGDVYLRTSFNGAVDLGGGPISALTADTVVGSYDPSGGHRWSRDFPIAGNYLAGIDGCGSLVVASNDFSHFDAGYGSLYVPGSPYAVWYAAMVRFAP
ncbi:Endoglucanase [Minicystis rosea]|nr:Endoglucanase [Minicystis rosea]